MESEAKADLFRIMYAALDGYDAIRKAVIEGRIDGMWPNLSTSTKRGCFKAHLGIKYEPSPIESYTYSVALGDTPERSEVLRNVLQWLDEWKSGDGIFEYDEVPDEDPGEGVDF